MTADRPAVPPPGSAAIFPLPVLTAAGGAPELAGLILHGDGRVTIAHRGAGLAVRLGPDDAAQLGMMLLALSGELAARRREAAEAAGADLARIVHEAGNG
ncbi:hypothetical protein [Elioraea sp.]|uniref:hypothetical protein n=1 Tax=Elioraea sp. TaxID=2185103 RepID=UPI003F72E3C2